MKKQHFKICSFLTALLIILTMLYVPQDDKVYADSASVTIALSASNVRIGQSVTATINVSGSSISAYTMYVSYSSGVLQYSSATGVVGGGGGTLTVSGTGPGSTSITFSAIANGTASISTSGSEFYDINGTALDVSHAGVSVTVATEEKKEEKKEEKSEATTNEKGETEATTEEDDRSDDCDLASLSVSPGSLSPSFSAGQTSYTVELTEDDTSIVVSAVTHDSKASTSVSGANSLQKGTNRVSVTVTAENGAVKVYYLTVMCGKDKEDILVSVDGRNYIIVTEDLPDPPENFSEVTLVVGEEDVPGYESPNGKLAIICLEDEDGGKGWFIYDRDKNSYTKYAEFSARYVRYVIVDKPEGLDIPKGFSPAKLEIEEDSFNAYTDGSTSGIYLVYAMNLDGTEGFYFYDSKEGSFMRYEAAGNIIASMSDAQIVPVTTEEVTVEATTAAPVIPKKDTEPKDEGFFTKARLKFLLIAMSVLFVIMCIAVIVLIIKNGNMTVIPEEGRYPDNEDDDQDADADVSGTSEETVDIADAHTDKLTKNKSYEVNQDTGEIQLEVAEDFNSSVNVPLAVEERKDKIENAKKERPYGIDSAFDVIPESEAGGLDADVARIVEQYTSGNSDADIPADSTMAQEVPVHETSIQNASVQEIKIQETPIQNVHVQEAPVQAKGTYTEVREVPKQKVVLPGQDDEEE